MSIHTSEPENEVTRDDHSVRPRLVVGLLFVVALINYFDRQSLSVVAPRFQAELHLSDVGYAHIVSLFLLASAFAYALAGFISDAVGTRRSMALFVALWSVAEAATAFATSAVQLGVARFCLGLGEPGLWVAAPKAVGEVFPKSQRGMAIGIYTMGATVGAIIAIPSIAFVTSRLPWRWIFLIDGSVGLLWIPLWLLCYQYDRSQSSLPLPHTQSDIGTLRGVLTRHDTWRLMIARGMTDPVWYFYLFWFPKYLFNARHLSLIEIAHIGWFVYLAAGIGTIAGGALSAWLIRKGMTVSLANRRVMLLAAMIIPLSPVAALVPNALFAVLIASIIAMAHMAWLVTLTSTIVEIFPASEVGKAAGLVAAGSGFGGMISSEIIGYFVTHQGFLPIFIIMAVLHPLALWILWKSFSRTIARPITPENLEAKANHSESNENAIFSSFS